MQSTFKHIHTLTVQTITGNAAHWRSSCCGIMTGSKHRSRHRRSGDFTRAAADRRPPIQSFRSNSRARKFLIGRTLCLSNKCKKEAVRSIGQFLCFYKRENINVLLSQQRQVLMMSVRQDAKTSRNNITKNANWLFTNVGDTPVFSIYSTLDQNEPTVLYEVKGEQA